MSPEPIQEILGPPPQGAPWPVKVLWYAADMIATGLMIDQFDYGVPMNPAPQDANDPAGDVWMHCVVVYEDTVSLDTADDQAWSFDIVNYTGDLVDNTWTDGDFTQVNVDLSQFVVWVNTIIPTRLTCKELRFYRRMYNPSSITKPWPDSGAPEKIIPIQTVGSGVGSSAPQVCTTITEETPSRKNWGRIYLPTISSSVIGTNGRLGSTFCTDAATKYGQFIERLWSHGFRMVVPTTSLGGQKDIALEGDWSVVPKRVLQAVTATRCDDVLDTQRRRRFHSAQARARYPVATAATQLPALELAPSE